MFTNFCVKPKFECVQQILCIRVCNHSCMSYFNARKQHSFVFHRRSKYKPPTCVMYSRPSICIENALQVIFQPIKDLGLFMVKLG